MLEFKRAFKNKTIEKTLNAKVEEWLKSIEKLADDEVDPEGEKKKRKEITDAIRKDIVITGGAIASMLGGHLPNDYDIYFKTVETTMLIIKYYIENLPDVKNDKTAMPIVRENTTGGVEIMVQSAGVAGEGEDIEQDSYDYFEFMPNNSSEVYLGQLATKETGKYKVAFMTSNAITLTDSIQIIIRFCGEPESIHDNYDFLHCTNYWTIDGGLVTRPDAVLSIMTRELKYVGSLFPICSLFRLRKFIERGWTITAGEIFKMAWDVSKLDLNNYNVLREQLIGVDTAYFGEVLSVLQNNGYDSTKDIDRTYLFELISRTFCSSDIA